MRFAAPLAILAGALAVLLATPAGVPILGMDHHGFAAAAMGLAVLIGLITRPRAADLGRVAGSLAIWAAAAILLTGVYAYRYEAAEFFDRVALELMPAEPQVGEGGSVVVNRRIGGEFAVVARVNGARTSFIFDTGASVVVLTAADARRAGVHGGLNYDAPVSTANGMALAAAVRLDELAVGPIVERNVRALVVKPGALDESLLGMSFLERLKSFTVERGRLILTQK